MARLLKQLLVRKNTKKNSQHGFTSWLLRRRTDEEIIRLTSDIAMSLPKPGLKLEKLSVSKYLYISGR